MKAKTIKRTQGAVRLTSVERSLLSLIRDGADVTGYTVAKGLRALDRKRPGLMTICEPLGNYDPRGQVPYFGAIVTAKGRAALAQKR